MIIKIADEYLDFDGDILVDRQIMNVEKLESVGNFSYSIRVEPTSHNKRVLGVENINKTNKIIFVDRIAELQSNDGITIHFGSIIVTNTLGIDISFISGNTNWFNLIQGNVNDVDLAHLDVLLSVQAVTDSWTESEGIVFPIVDRGGLSTRKDPFLKIRIFRGEVQYNDFQPFIYVKEAVNGILKKAGLKIEGDLIKDPTYNSLITTNNSNKYYERKFKENNIYIGKTVPQTITDAGFTKLTFDDTTSIQFFNSPNLNFDPSTNRWTVDFDSQVKLTLEFETSDVTKLINFETRRNGADIQDNYLNGTIVTFTVADEYSAVEERAVAGDYYEIWAKVDPTTPGSVDILAGTWKAEILDTAMVFAQALLPQQTSREFIKDIFKLFNVVCTYDIFSKTITTKFFNNIKQSEDQDLSEYLTRVVSEPGFELVSDYAKSNLLEYQVSDTPEIERYNEQNVIGFGNGSIDIDNDFIEDESDLLSVNYAAPFSQRYPVYGLQLIKIDFVEYEIEDFVTVTSVANSGGLGSFNSLYEFRNNFYKGDADGNIDTMTPSDVDVDTQILAVNIPNFDLPISLYVTNDNPTGDVGLYRLRNFTISGYNGDWERDTADSSLITSAAVAMFAKFTDGTDMDKIKQGLSFGEIENKDSLTLKETYYDQTERLLNDPVKPICEFIMPENVYRNLDFKRPIRLKTEKFNGLFYINKDTGYVSSSKEFTMELVKLD